MLPFFLVNEMKDENELKNIIESKVITKTFNISGVPLTIWNEIDSFCKEMYGDARWIMVADLIKQQKDDYKYAAIYDTVESLRQEIANISNVKESVSRNVIKSFGKKMVKENE